jgi:hypothetical protein
MKGGYVLVFSFEKQVVKWGTKAEAMHTAFLHCFKQRCAGGQALSAFVRTDGMTH